MKGILIAGTLFALPLTAAEARPCSQSDGGGRFGRVERMERMGIADNLTLSPQQREQLQKHRFDQRKSMITLHSKLDMLRIELDEAAFAGKPDMRKIDRIAEKIGNVHTEMTKKRIHSRIQVNNILTDEQKQSVNNQRTIMPMASISISASMKAGSASWC